MEICGAYWNSRPDLDQFYKREIKRWISVLIRIIIRSFRSSKIRLLSWKLLKQNLYCSVYGQNSMRSKRTFRRKNSQKIWPKLLTNSTTLTRYYGFESFTTYLWLWIRVNPYESCIRTWRLKYSSPWWRWWSIVALALNISLVRKSFFNERKLLICTKIVYFDLMESWLAIIEQFS